MNKINKCDSCNNVYSHRQSLWRHRQNCNNNRIRAVEQPIRKPQHLKRKNACSVPYEPETVMGTDVKQYVGSGKVHNQQHSKTLNPKISALADAILNDESSTPTMSDIKIPVNKDTTPTKSLESMSISPAPKKKTLSINKLFPPRDDLTSKVDGSDDCSDDNESYSGIEPVDMTAEDDRDDDENETEDGSGGSDDCTDDNESYSGIEPLDMTAEDDRDEDEDEEEDEDKDKDEDNDKDEDDDEDEEDEDESFLQKIERNLKEITSEIDENMLYNIIFDIVKYLSYHDVREMRDILDQLAENTMIEEEVEELKKLIPSFLDNIYTDISQIENTIENIEHRDESIPKSLLFRFMMLLKEFRRNHIRISNILRRMKHVFDNEYTVKEDISDGLKALARERLISEDQYSKLMGMVDTLDMKKLIEIVMSEKVGRGIDFIPRKTQDLQKKLYAWASSYSDEQQPELKNKIMAALDELRFRKALTKREYNDILKEMN